MVHYVGITCDVKARYRAHRHQRSTNPQKIAWIQELESQGLQPRLEVIDKVFGEHLALAYEREYMRLYIEQGAPLKNVVGHPTNRRAAS